MKKKMAAQFEDKYSESDGSDDEREEVSAEAPRFRMPRNAQINAYNQRCAQNYQDNLLTH